MANEAQGIENIGAWKMDGVVQPEAVGIPVVAAHKNFFEQRLESRFSESLHTGAALPPEMFFRNGEDPKSWAGALVNFVKKYGGLPMALIGMFMSLNSTTNDQRLIAAITATIGAIWAWLGFRNDKE